MTKAKKPGPRWHPDCRCHYCGQRLAGPGGNKPHSFTRDHVVPRSAGGPDTPGNIVPACLRCNQAKASLSLDQWRTMFLQRGFGIPHFSENQRQWLERQGFQFPATSSPFFWFELNDPAFDPELEYLLS